MKLFIAVVLVALAAVVLAAKKNANDDKVKITLYYESRCPACKAFVTQQLAPVWRDLRDLIEVMLVPYGKATHIKIDGKWQFTCQHGPDECYGNKETTVLNILASCRAKHVEVEDIAHYTTIQACILRDQHLGETNKVEIIVCLMSQANPEKSLELCATQVKQTAELERLRACADSEQGSTLLAAYGDKTKALRPPLAFVPTIVVNEHFNQTIQDEAVADLKAVVCRISEKKPPACS